MSGLKSTIYFLFLLVIVSSCEKDDGNEPSITNEEEATTNIGETIIVGNSENMTPFPVGISISISPGGPAQTNTIDVNGDGVLDFKIYSFWSVSPSHSRQYHNLFSLHENVSFLTVTNSRSVYQYHDSISSPGFIRTVTSCTELNDPQLSFIDIIEPVYTDIAPVDSLESITFNDVNFVVDTLNILGTYGNEYMSSGPAGHQSNYNLNCDPNETFVGRRQYLLFRINNPEDEEFKLGWFKVEMATEADVNISEAFIQQ